MKNIINFPSNKSLAQRTAELITDASISPEQLEDASIRMLQRRIDRLQKQRGKNDWRLLIVVICTLIMITALFTWNIWTLFLLPIAIGGIYIGSLNHTSIVKIDQEISATNLLLVELLKERILKQTQRDIKKNISLSLHN